MQQDQRGALVRAAGVADDARAAASDVAGTAKEQASKVASEATGQAKQLFGQATGELKEQAGGQRLEVMLVHPEQLAKAEPVIQRFGDGPVQIDERRSRLFTPVSATDGLLAQVVLALDAEGIAINDLGVRKPTLDDVFLQLTGRELSVEETTESEVVDVKERQAA